MAEELDPTSSEAVSRRYRELSAEEPPRALDEAILAAARREAGAGPTAQSAPSARSGRQRWYAPLAAAAVLVLAVAVTLQMQIERPGIDSPAPQAAAPQTDLLAATSASPVAEAELKLKVDAQLKPAKAQAAREMAPARGSAAEPAAPAVPPAPAAAAASVARVPQPFATNQAAGAASRSDDSRAESSGPAENAKSAEAQAAPQAQKQAESPERELERIAQLRAQGRHDEADRALAEFRKRYPEFRISEAMRERVERR